MTTVTTRDKVWLVTLAHISGHDSFRLADLPIDDSERITAQRVWRVMEHFGILERHEDRRTWYRSFTAAILLEFSATDSLEWDSEHEWMNPQE
jgi:hypothetical protein